jgi:hypothetical protein
MRAAFCSRIWFTFLALTPSFPCVIALLPTPAGQRGLPVPSGPAANLFFFLYSFPPPLQVTEGSFLKKSLFHWGYNRKLHFLQKGLAYDKVGWAGLGWAGLGWWSSGAGSGGRAMHSRHRVSVLRERQPACAPDSPGCCLLRCPRLYWPGLELTDAPSLPCCTARRCTALSRRPPPSLTSSSSARSRRSSAAACAWWCQVREAGLRLS